MARATRALAETSRIADIHNRLRREFALPGPVASFVNENTVVRAAAAMEHYLMKRVRRRVTVSCKRILTLKDLVGDWQANSDWPDICVRTLFVLRHSIVHLEGRYRPRSLRKWSREHLLPAYREFAKQVPHARATHGKALRLSGQEVLAPLLRGCSDYWRRRRRTRPEPSVSL